MTVLTRPITTWPGTTTKHRIASPFTVPRGATVDLLEYELDKVGGTRAVLQLAIQERDIRIDGVVRADSRPSHPGVILSFESKYGPLSYACDHFDNWRDNVRAIALSLEALRKVSRYGVATSGQQYTGWKALPDQLTKEEAQALLDAYGGEKLALRKTHPDLGGNREDFARVQAARRKLGL